MLSVVASTYLLVLLRFNPRLFLRYFPKQILEIVPPRSDRERRMSILLGFPPGLWCKFYSRRATERIEQAMDAQPLVKKVSPVGRQNGT